MKRIFKYELDLDPAEQAVFMPEGARLLAAGVQSGHFAGHFEDHLVVWAEVDPAGQPVPRSFLVLATGSHIEATLNYFATVQWPGNLVWHIYAGL